uniref:Uncharacterized protein n=1 Tax=Janibacter limosus TaxID=53458 RepID=A0AC61U2Z8_9MICO|nr:hypothetical protein [Janibacter limosus]
MTQAPTDCADPASTVEDGEVRRWNDNFNRGRSRLHRQDARGSHRRLRRPRRRHRLQRLPVDGRRARRSRRLPAQAGVRQERADRAAGRPAAADGQGGAGLRAHAQDPRRRLGPAADRAPADLHVVHGAGGDQDLAAAASGPALPIPRRSDEVDDRRRRHWVCGG